jgi:hypothetical protein
VDIVDVRGCFDAQFGIVLTLRLTFTPEVKPVMSAGYTGPPNESFRSSGQAIRGITR